MRIPFKFVAPLALGLAAACTSEEPCSAELYAKKHADLAAKLASFTAKDPAKRDAVIAGLHDVLDKREAAGPDGDLSATCKAIDELMV